MLYTFLLWPVLTYIFSFTLWFFHVTHRSAPIYPPPLSFCFVSFWSPTLFLTNVFFMLFLFVAVTCVLFLFSLHKIKANSILISTYLFNNGTFILSVLPTGCWVQKWNPTVLLQLSSLTMELFQLFSLAFDDVSSKLFTAVDLKCSLGSLPVTRLDDSRYISICLTVYHHHNHHVVPLAHISLTLSRHISLSFIASSSVA